MLRRLEQEEEHQNLPYRRKRVKRFFAEPQVDPEDGKKARNLLKNGLVAVTKIDTWSKVMR